MRDEIAPVTKDELYWKNRALQAENCKIVIYLDEGKVKSVYCNNPKASVSLMDADDNYVKEKELEKYHTEQTKEMSKLSINEIQLT